MNNTKNNLQQPQAAQTNQTLSDCELSDSELTSIVGGSGLSSEITDFAKKAENQVATNDATLDNVVSSDLKSV